MDESIQRAAATIRRGGLVAFPTETVYGLGANALDDEACRGIFEAKGRPGDNPLIVHVDSMDQLGSICQVESDYRIGLLADIFWPGPLTMVVCHNGTVPPSVTGGRDTVAVRMPAHPVAQALIRAAGLPIAAPSANISGRPSPTTAAHVRADFGAWLEVLDGGAAQCGLESTIVDISVDTACLLRPGFVTIEQLRGVLGRVDVWPGAQGDKHGAPKAPGMAYAHYQPNAVVSIVDKMSVQELVDRAVSEGAGIICTDEDAALYANCRVFSLGSRDAAAGMAASLFATLRRLDEAGIKTAYAIPLYGNGIEAAIMDRLRKAAAFRSV